MCGLVWFYFSLESCFPFLLSWQKLCIHFVYAFQQLLIVCWCILHSLHKFKTKGDSWWEWDSSSAEWCGIFGYLDLSGRLPFLSSHMYIHGCHYYYTFLGFYFLLFHENYYLNGENNWNRRMSIVRSMNVTMECGFGETINVWKTDTQVNWKEIFSRKWTTDNIIWIWIADILLLHFRLKTFDILRILKAS